MNADMHLLVAMLLSMPRGDEMARVLRRWLDPMAINNYRHLDTPERAELALRIGATFLEAMRERCPLRDALLAEIAPKKPQPLGDGT